MWYIGFNWWANIDTFLSYNYCITTMYHIIILYITIYIICNILLYILIQLYYCKKYINTHIIIILSKSTLHSDFLSFSYYPFSSRRSCRTPCYIGLLCAEPAPQICLFFLMTGQFWWILVLYIVGCLPFGICLIFFFIVIRLGLWLWGEILSNF